MLEDPPCVYVIMCVGVIMCVDVITCVDVIMCTVNIWCALWPCLTGGQQSTVSVRAVRWPTTLRPLWPVGGRAVLRWLREGPRRQRRYIWEMIQFERHLPCQHYYVPSLFQIDQTVRKGDCRLCSTLGWRISKRCTFVQHRSRRGQSGVRWETSDPWQREGVQYIQTFLLTMVHYS